MVAKVNTDATKDDISVVSGQSLAFAKAIADRIQHEIQLNGAHQTLSVLGANLNRTWAIYFS